MRVDEKLAAIRALILGDPGKYGTIDSEAAAQAAHTAMYAQAETVWQDVPVAKLAGEWELMPWNAGTEPGVFVYDKLVEFAAGADGASKRVAAKVLRIFAGVHVTAFQMADAAKRAAIIGMLDGLVEAGMSAATYNATLALARRPGSPAEVGGLPGPETCSPADVWEAFGWPGKDQ